MQPDERRRRMLAGEPVAESVGPAPWAEDGPLRNQIRAGAFASPKVKQWRDELTRVRRDLTDILMSRQVIGKLRDVIARNERLQRWNVLLDRILRWYGTSTLVLMAREVDTGKRVVSLVRLLDDIRRHPEELTRERYRRLHTGSAHAAAPSADPFALDPAHFEGELLDRAYDEIAGPNHQTFNVELIAAEIAELEAVADTVQQLRHTEYAHRAADGPAFPSIQLQAIHDFIDVAERLVKKYISVLFYESARLEPVDQTNWTEILTFPWIIAPERDTSIRYAATSDLLLKMYEALRPEEQAQVRERLR